MRTMKFAAVATFAVTLLTGSVFQTAPVTAQDGGVVVFAAASLKNALDNAAAHWQKDSGTTVKISYAGSSALAKQIEQGAPAQIFISADLAWMDYLDKKDLIQPDTRSNLLGNRIVLVTPKDKAAKIDLKAGVDLGPILGDGRLAMANTAAVPAGKYGKAALEKLGIWNDVAGKVAQADNVRAALLLVSRGEAAAGIVYKTDAAADPNVAIAGIFPESTHPAIIYPVALVKGQNTANAKAFLDFIKSAKARNCFEEQGFAMLGGRS